MVEQREFAAMRGTPWEPVPGGGVREIKTSIHLPVEDETPEIITAANKESVVKRAPISAEWIKKYGYTKGCKGCDHIKQKKSPYVHNEECRKNIESKMKAASDTRYEDASNRYRYSEANEKD